MKDPPKEDRMKSKGLLNKRSNDERNGQLDCKVGICRDIHAVVAELASKVSIAQE